MASDFRALSFTLAALTKKGTALSLNDSLNGILSAGGAGLALFIIDAMHVLISAGVI